MIHIDRPVLGATKDFSVPWPDFLSDESTVPVDVSTIPATAAVAPAISPAPPPLGPATSAQPHQTPAVSSPRASPQPGNSASSSPAEYPNSVDKGKAKQLPDLTDSPIPLPPATLPSGSANPKVAALLDLNAELLRACIALQEKAIPISDPRYQPFSNRLDSNINWLNTSPQLGSRSKLPILTPPPKIEDFVSDRIEQLYGALPAFFARDVARQQHQQSQSSPPPEATPTPAPQSPSVGVKRERSEDDAVPSAKRRNTGEPSTPAGSLSPTMPPPPVRPSVAAPTSNPPTRPSSVVNGIAHPEPPTRTPSRLQSDSGRRTPLQPPTTIAAVHTSPPPQSTPTIMPSTPSMSSTSMNPQPQPLQQQPHQQQQQQQQPSPNNHLAPISNPTTTPNLQQNLANPALDMVSPEMMRGWPPAAVNAVQILRSPHHQMTQAMSKFHPGFRNWNMQQQFAALGHLQRRAEANLQGQQQTPPPGSTYSIPPHLQAKNPLMPGGGGAPGSAPQQPHNNMAQRPPGMAPGGGAGQPFPGGGGMIQAGSAPGMGVGGGPQAMDALSQQRQFWLLEQQRRAAAGGTGGQPNAMSQQQQFAMQRMMAQQQFQNTLMATGGVHQQGGQPQQQQSPPSMSISSAGSPTSPMSPDPSQPHSSPQPPPQNFGPMRPPQNPTPPGAGGIPGIARSARSPTDGVGIVPSQPTSSMTPRMTSRTPSLSQDDFQRMMMQQQQQQQQQQQAGRGMPGVGGGNPSSFMTPGAPGPSGWPGAVGGGGGTMQPQQMHMSGYGGGGGFGQQPQHLQQQQQQQPQQQQGSPAGGNFDFSPQTLQPSTNTFEMAMMEQMRNGMQGHQQMRGGPSSQQPQQQQQMPMNVMMGMGGGGTIDPSAMGGFDAMMGWGT